MSILGYDDMVMWFGYPCNSCDGSGRVGLGGLHPCDKCSGLGYESFEGGLMSDDGIVSHEVEIWANEEREPPWWNGCWRLFAKGRQTHMDNQRGWEDPVALADHLVQAIIARYGPPYEPTDMRPEDDDGGEPL